MICEKPDTTNKMKLVWQSIGKSMDTQIDHAYIRIKTLNKERPKWERGMPWHQTINALSRKRVSAQLRNNLIYVIEHNKSIMYDH